MRAWDEAAMGAQNKLEQLGSLPQKGPTETLM